MTAIQRLLHAFSLLAAFADKDTLADYLQLASVIAGAVSDDSGTRRGARAASRTRAADR